MTLCEIGDSEILHVLHETYGIWSAGLSRANYLDYNQLQRTHTWGRRYQRFFALRSGGEIAASCKSYDIEVMARGKRYKFLGVGAVFSRHKFRGKGYGDQFMYAYRKWAETTGAAGILLFSDIGANFYERHGFQELSSIDFSIDVKAAGWQLGISQGGINKAEIPDYTIEPLDQSHCDYLQRNHQRWLSRRPFGIIRDGQYWHYKIAKELYLHQNSQLAWPRLQLLKIDECGNGGGYCIYEVGGSTMRILELADSGIGVQNLWSAVLTQATALQIRKLRGWEGNLRELSPGFNLKVFLGQENFQAEFKGQIHYSERDWGRAMLMPLDIEVEQWFENFPCPLMELDHL